MPSSTWRTSIAGSACTGRLRGRDQRSIEEVVASASIEVRSGILYATAIIVLVFLPLFALSGIEGRLFAPLGIAFIVSILASLVVSMTVTPVLCLLAAAAHEATWPSTRRSLVRVLKRWQKRGPRMVLRAAGLRHRPAGRRGRRSDPGGGSRCRARSCRRSTRGRCSSASSCSRASASPNRIVSGASPKSSSPQVPEVHSVGRRTGRAELDEHAEGVHNSELDVDLRDIGAQPRSRPGRHPHAPLRAAGQHHRRAADRASARPHAVGRARADRAQDLRRRLRHAARPRGRPRSDASSRSPASSICRPKSRCASRSCRCASITRRPSATA